MYFYWLYSPKNWGFEKNVRYNNGNTYTSYKIGPLLIKRYWK